MLLIRRLLVVICPMLRLVGRRERGVGAVHRYGVLRHPGVRSGVHLVVGGVILLLRRLLPLGLLDMGLGVIERSLGLMRLRQLVRRQRRDVGDRRGIYPCTVTTPCRPVTLPRSALSMPLELDALPVQHLDLVTVGGGVAIDSRVALIIEHVEKSVTLVLRVTPSTGIIWAIGY